MALENTPVIGLGCQRSGTSVTAHILASPERSGFWHESGIIRMSLLWFRNAISDGPTLASARYNEFIRALNSRSDDHGARVRGLATNAIVEYQTDGRLLEWIETEDGAAFIRQLCFDVLSRGEDVAYWGDKYPEHLFLIPEIYEVFPETKWLFIWREPASVIEALSRKMLTSTRRPIPNWRFSVEDCATQWTTWNRKWIEMRDQLPRENWMEVNFDQMVRDPNPELERVSELIEFDLLADKASKKRAAGLRPPDLEKWRKSEHVDEIEAQLERQDLRDVRAQLTGRRVNISG